MNDCFIADDLSGALDAAGAFFRAGRTVTVALSPDAWPEVPAGEVVGVSTETRNASPAAARAAAGGRAAAADAVQGFWAGARRTDVSGPG